MSNKPQPVKPNDSWLTHQWIVAGIVSASSRFIPIPFVDDIVRDQCRRFVVSTTLSAHDSLLTVDQLKPYYASSGGCLSGCAGTIVKTPLKLLLFPVRKLVSIVTSVHGVPLEITRMVLLGRTLDRYLRNGKWKSDRVFAAKMRTAFDESFARMDFRIVRAAMADALSSVKGWKNAAMKNAKDVAGPGNVGDDEIPASADVEAGADRIQEVLDRPQIMKLFAEFDNRFDRLLERPDQE